jgi:hypothetical protein
MLFHIKIFVEHTRLTPDKLIERNGCKTLDFYAALSTLHRSRTGTDVQGLAVGIRIRIIH